MRPGYLGDLGDFGITGAGAAVVVAAGEVAVNAVAAVKKQEMSQTFAKQFRSNDQKLDFIRNIVLRYKGAGRRLTSTTDARPGTDPFEQELANRLKSEMIYRGKCNADIYMPLTKRGQAQQIIGKFYRSGYFDSKRGKFPKEAGATWSGGCKNAQDGFRSNYLKKRKGSGKFKQLKAVLEDTGTITLFLKVGVGFLMLLVMGMAIRAQKKVLVYEKTH
jgi:hypothetical protein